MITVLFFGKMADVAAKRSLSLAATEGELLFAMRDRVFAEALAAGKVTTDDIRMSLNKQVVITDQPVKAGDEVAFFSIFSGG